MGASPAIIESGEIRCLPAKRPKWLVLVRVDVVGGEYRIAAIGQLKCNNSACTLCLRCRYWLHSRTGITRR